VRKRDNGFSLIEMLIVLAVIAALIAVVTPLALNAIRSAKATSVSANFKTLSTSIYNHYYVENYLPDDIDLLVRDLNEDTYGIAHKEAGGVYEYVLFTTENANLSKIHEMLPNVSSTIPENEEEYIFLNNGRDTFENLTAKYIVSFNSEGLVGPSSTFDLNSYGIGDASAFHSIDDGGWKITENGLQPDFDESGWNKKAIFNGDQTSENYVVNATAQIINPGSGGGRGYAIYIRATGEAEHINAYAFQIDPGIDRFIVRIVENGGEVGVASQKSFSSLGIVFDSITEQKIQIQADGNHFIMKFNGTEVLNFTDDTYSEGWVGVRHWGSIRLAFSRFTVN